jgi:hypothetical protein
MVFTENYETFGDERKPCLGRLLIFGCPAGKEDDFVVGTPDAAESVGERLFLETRFAQAFKAFLNSGGKVNEPIPAGDPVLHTSRTHSHNPLNLLSILFIGHIALKNN